MRKLEEFPSYVIYEDGRIFSHISRKFLSPATSKTGYKYLVLKNKNGEDRTVRVHRLVAECYIPNVENKEEVNHKDGDKSHNHHKNLEWVTSKENKTHAWENNLYTHKCSEHYAATVPDEDVHAMCQMMEDGARNIDIVQAFDVDKHFVANLRTGRNWKTISSQYNLKVNRKERKSPKTIIKICEMIVGGKSNSQIARELDIKPKDVSRVRNKQTHVRISCDYF